VYKTFRSFLCEDIENEYIKRILFHIKGIMLFNASNKAKRIKEDITWLYTTRDQEMYIVNIDRRETAIFGHDTSSSIIRVEEGEGVVSLYNKEGDYISDSKIGVNDVVMLDVGQGCKIISNRINLKVSLTYSPPVRYSSCSV
jgi:hypothetical protein